MNCDQDQKSLLYLWGEMTPSESQAFAEHLAECPACSKQVADLKPFVRAMQSVEPEELPHELTQRIKDRLADALQAQPHRIWLTPRRSLAVAASILLIVGLSLLFKTTLDRTQRSPSPPKGSTRTQEIALTEEDYVEALALVWIAEPQQDVTSSDDPDDILAAQLEDLTASIDSLLQEVDQDLTPQGSDVEPQDGQGSHSPATGRTTSV